MDTAVNGVDQPVAPTRLLSRAEMRAQRQAQEVDGVEWFLTRPVRQRVKIRLLSVADKAFLDILPTSAQEFLITALADLSGSSAKARSDKSPAYKRAINNVATTIDCARILAPHAFLWPRVVGSEAELPDAEDPDHPVWWVDDLHEDDLLRLYSLVAEADPAAIAALKPFRAGPSADVPAEPDEQAAAPGLGVDRPRGDDLVAGGDPGLRPGDRTIRPVDRGAYGGDGRSDGASGSTEGLTPQGQGAQVQNG